MVLVKKHRALFKALKQVKNKNAVRILLKYIMSDARILPATICELLHNMDNGCLKVPHRKLKGLRRYKRSIKYLLSPNLSLDNKAAHLNKQGGGIGLISALLPLAINLVTSLIPSK